MRKKMKMLSACMTLVLLLTACGGTVQNGNDSSSNNSSGSGTDPIMEEPLVKEIPDDGHCHIGILTYRNHSACDEAIEGFEEEFQKLMGSTPVDFEQMDADGDAGKCAEIATGFANNGYKLIYACGTEAVQNAGAAVSDVPIIGVCVTDFLLSEVVSSLEAPGRNITGVSCLGPIDLQMDQITNVLPWPSKVGIVSSGTEVGSRFQVSIAGQCLEEKGIEWESYNGDTEETLREALEQAAEECSCLYLPTDSFVASHMDIAKEVSLNHQIPVVTADYHMCRNGGLFCYSVDYQKQGEEAAEMAFEVLEEDEEISRMSIREGKEEDLQQYYNPEMSEALGWYNYGAMSPLLIGSEEEGATEEDQMGEGY